MSAERLAHALWGEEAPAGAVGTVQVHVSRLRKGARRRPHRGDDAGGHRLRVLPGELDAERFERLVEDGPRALSAGHAEHAADVLREALALWRGQPLADLESELFAQTEIARLEEQHLAAIETRIEADLAAGRHSEIVAELRGLAAQHPTRERLAGQLMLALYRCGRQGWGGRGSRRSWPSTCTAAAPRCATPPAPAPHEQLLDALGGASRGARPALVVFDDADRAERGMLIRLRELAGGSALVVATAETPRRLPFSSRTACWS